jgi:hypothetical protein
METAVEILQLISVSACALLTGGQMFCLVAVIPALPAFPTDVSAHVHQEALSRRPHHFLRIVALVTMVSALAILVVERDLGEASMIFTLIGLLLVAANAVISSREWPINHEIDSWGSGPIPEGYPRLRAQWDQQHLWRTALSVPALACLVAGAILY